MSYLEAHIDLEAVGHNLRVVRSLTGHRKILAVVKANAYGHGAIPVSRALLSAGADALGVAHLEEAIELREAGIAAPIFLLFGFDPAVVPEVLRHELIPVIWSINQAEMLSREASRAGREVVVHVKVDTGMGRVGVSPECAVEEISRICKLPWLTFQGLSSHFSDAELSDPQVVEEQMAVFQGVVDRLSAAGIRVPLRHMANSAAVIRFPEAHYEMVRPGLMLYGYNPVSESPPVDLRPAMTVSTRVVAVKRVPTGTPISYGRTFRAEKDSVIATLAVGYADGFSRMLSNQGRVLINGREVPVAGRVCMDLTMVDVTGAGTVQAGHAAVLLGQQGRATLWADRVASMASTIPYEVLTSVGKRVKRIYHNE